MAEKQEEVCLHYMGFGICAKGLDADTKECCRRCSNYETECSNKKKEPKTTG